jgi:transcriptional regulator with XRE-family HTH domain
VKQGMSNWKTLRDEILSNPQVAEEYERLRPQYELASDLIKLRKALGLTQRELAAMAGVTQPEIARIESGRIAPRWDKVVHLLRSVGASVQIVPPKGRQQLAQAAGGTVGSTSRSRTARTGRYLTVAHSMTHPKTTTKEKKTRTSTGAKGGPRHMTDKHKNVHTVPRESGGWAIKKEGPSRASATFPTKAEAVAAGRERAKSSGVEHLIHNKDGRIAERNSYGNDPYPPKG